jgi:hypothetical protein
MENMNSGRPIADRPQRMGHSNGKSRVILDCNPGCSGRYQLSFDRVCRPNADQHGGTFFSRSE